MSVHRGPPCRADTRHCCLSCHSRAQLEHDPQRPPDRSPILFPFPPSVLAKPHSKGHLTGTTKPRDDSMHSPPRISRSCFLRGTGLTFITSTNAAGRESAKNFLMIQMCDYHTRPFTHLRKGSQDPCSFWLCAFHSFHCVTIAKEGNIQLPALSHCHPPKKHRVLDCCFTGAAEPIAQYSPLLLRWLQTTTSGRNY